MPTQPAKAPHTGYQNRSRAAPSHPTKSTARNDPGGRHNGAVVPPSPRPDPIAALLLTGGASRRMGRDKATLVVGGEQLASRTAALLATVAHPVIEVGPGFTHLVCTREEMPGAGPLAAVAAGAAALQALPPGGVSTGGRMPALVVATDMPNLTVGLLRLLAEHPASGCVVPLDPAGQAQPTCARYSPEALALAPELVAAGRRSLMALLDQVPTTWLPPAAWVGPAGRADALVDLDTPDDLAAVPPLQ